jgi:hypothetical protein
MHALRTPGVFRFAIRPIRPDAAYVGSRMVRTATDRDGMISCDIFHELKGMPGPMSPFLAIRKSIAEDASFKVGWMEPLAANSRGIPRIDILFRERWHMAK